MQERYKATQRWLHWLVVLLVAVQAVFGLWMAEFEPKDDATKYLLCDIHQNSGFTLLLLMLVRLGWRMTHRTPPLPPGLPEPLRWVARLNHAAFYLLLLALPVLGVLATTAWGFPFSYLGLAEVPVPVGHDEALAPRLSWLHDNGAFLLLALVVLHVGAACWHQWVRKDGTLEKML